MGLIDGGKGQINLEEYTTEGYIPEPPKKIAKVKHNTGKEDWYTPREILSVVDEYMGIITLDPMSSKEANREVEANHFYTKEDDGLTKPWFGNVWLNPPYNSKTMEQVAKKIVESVQGDVDRLLLLSNNATETIWCQEILLNASAICFPKSRIRFVDGVTGKRQNSPIQGQIITLFLGKNVDHAEEVSRFMAIFAKLGVVIP